MISAERALLPAVLALSGARQVLRLLVSRLPRPVQHRAASALQMLAARWPRLASLLGMTTSSSVAVVADREVMPAGDGHRSVESSRMRATYLADLQRNPNFLDRVYAARALASLPDEETTAALAAALRDASAEVAVEAAEALARHRGPSATSALKAALDNRDGYYSPITRAASVRSLGVLLPPDEAMLIAAAVADVDPTVSLAAIAGLADRDDAASTHALTAVLEDRAGYYLPLTRQAAARALLRLRRWDERRCGPLLEDESDASVREALVALKANAHS
jgi:HEAT repeat protein